MRVNKLVFGIAIYVNALVYYRMKNVCRDWSLHTYYTSVKQVLIQASKRIDKRKEI